MSTEQAHVHADPTEAIEALARTVAHLAVQLTITQIQLRGLGQALAESGAVDGEAVLRATATLARQHAGRFIAENLGDALANLVDTKDLEAQIISFLESD